MALKIIPGQAVSFDSSNLVNKCGEGLAGRIAALTDTLSFQIGVGTPIGSQLINDPDIDNLASDWTVGTGWSISAGKAVALNASGTLSNSWVTRSGAYYKAVVYINTYGGGDLIVHVQQ